MNGAASLSLDWLENEPFEARLKRLGFETVCAQSFGDPGVGWSIEVYDEVDGDRSLVDISDGIRIKELILGDLMEKARFLAEYVPVIRALNEEDALTEMFDHSYDGQITVTWAGEDDSQPLSGPWRPVPGGMVSELLSYRGSKTWRQMFIPWTAISNVVVESPRGDRNTHTEERT